MNIIKKILVTTVILVVLSYLLVFSQTAKLILLKYYADITFPYYYFTNIKLTENMMYSFFESEKIYSPDKKHEKIQLSNNIKNNNETNYNVMMIFLDALVKDHLGCYGYKRNTTPNIDSLAKRGNIFTNLYTQSAWTKASTASFLSSLYQFNHLAIDRFDALPEQVLTLPEILLSKGYRTCGVVNNSNVGIPNNFHQGFNYFLDSSIMSNLDVTGKAVKWLNNNFENKFFMFLFYKETHPMFKIDNKILSILKLEPKEINTTFDKEWDDFDRKLKLVDNKIGLLVLKLRELKILKNTIIIITSDHGEEYDRHASELHGHSLYNVLLNVPFIISFPGGNGRKIDARVRAIDVLPTILEFVGINNNFDFDGKSFYNLLNSRNKDFLKDEYILSENELSLYSGSFLDLFSPDYLYNRIKSVQNKKYKYIYNYHNDIKELYDISSDPEEKRNIIDSNRALGKKMQIILNEMLKQKKNTIRKRKTDKTESHLNQLKSLGYLK